MANFHLFKELKRRNVLRAAALYAGAVWALSQGIAQLGSFVGVPGWAVRWFIVACVIGFPFFMAFAWFFEFTPSGLKRESEIDPADSIAHSTGRKLNYWIFGVMALAIVLLLTNQFVLHHGVNEQAAIIAPPNSIAVLPLINESGDPKQQYFSDGLSEDLITALSQFAGLKVISRDSSFRFRNSPESSAEIGEKLGVAHLLEGSVQRDASEVRISAELVNAADGSTLWSQSYDRPYNDLFALQDVVTKSVADALKAKLLAANGAVVQSDRPPSGNLAAYNDFLRGKFYDQTGTEAGMRQAVSQFNKATQLDPNYAAAYAAEADDWGGIAATYLTTAADQQHAYAEAHRDAATALRLDPDLAAAHEAREGLMVSVDFDWSGALAEAQRAMQLDPGSTGAKFNLGGIQARLGHVEAAVELDQQALTSAPLNALGYFGLGRKLIGLGQLDDAQAALRKSIALAPGASRPYTYLALISILRGDAAAALAAAKQEPAGYWHDFAVALALQVSPDRAAADAALIKNMIAEYSAGASYQIAEIYALRRQPDEMFKWLEQARINRDAGIELMLFDPLILRYQHDPRFAAFCKKVGLPTTTDAKAMP